MCADIDPHLEANYNIVAARDDVDELMQRWSAQSAAQRDAADTSLDCIYGKHEREQIDVFRCGEPDAPLYVYIHGGYWQRGDKSLYSFITAPFLAANIDVAIIGYPLCPEVSMTELLNSIRHAISWLYLNAAQLGINPHRINLSGHSAGGHLTTMAMCTDWPNFAAGLPADLLKTAIPFSGLYDLEPLLQTSISEVLHLTDDEIRNLSPVRLLPYAKIPLLSILGGAETGEFFRQTDALQDAWSSLLPQVDRHVEPGVDHLDLIDRLADSDSQIFQCISAWIR
jgi:arylformamidase